MLQAVTKTSNVANTNIKTNTYNSYSAKLRVSIYVLRAIFFYYLDEIDDDVETVDELEGRS